MSVNMASTDVVALPVQVEAYYVCSLKSLDLEFLRLVVRRVVFKYRRVIIKIFVAKNHLPDAVKPVSYLFIMT
jgi:hypothetical protein